MNALKKMFGFFVSGLANKRLISSDNYPFDFHHEANEVLGVTDDAVIDIEKIFRLSPIFHHQVSDIIVERPFAFKVFEARHIASQLNDNAGDYAKALKAVAFGRHDQADQLLKEVLTPLDKQQNKNKEALIRTYISLMHNNVYGGNNDEALKYCKLLVPLSSNNSYALSEIAACYYDNYRYDLAKKYYNEALAVDESLLSSKSPLLVDNLRNLSKVYIETDHFQDAKELLRRVIDIFENKSNDMPLELMASLVDLGQLFCLMGRDSEAKPLCKRALKISKESFAKDDTAVVWELKRLVILFLYLKHKNKGWQLAYRVMHLFKIIMANKQTSLGKDHIELSLYYNELSGLSKNIGNYANARKFKKHELSIKQANLDDDDPSLISTLGDLACIYYEKDSFDDALGYLERVGKYYMQNIDEISCYYKYPNAARDMLILADSYLATEQISKAYSLTKLLLSKLIDQSRKNEQKYYFLGDAASMHVKILIAMGKDESEAISQVNSMAPDLFNFE